jgi:hypothetical protein
MDGTILTDKIVVADAHIAFLSRIKRHILGIMPDNRTHMYLVAFTNRCVSAHDSMRHDFRAPADTDVLFDYHIRSDLNVISQAGPIRN